MAPHVEASEPASRGCTRRAEDAPTRRASVASNRWGSPVVRGRRFAEPWPGRCNRDAPVSAPDPCRDPANAPAKLRVLLVDDDRLVGAAVSEMLRPHHVMFVQSAVGAVARLQAGGKFDVIVCDFCMPGMSGLEFHAEVAKLAPALARNMVFLTVASSSPEMTEFLAVQPHPCLSKPVHGEALTRAVVAAAGGKVGRAR
jgi:CheY-like chemotaxis protein